MSEKESFPVEDLRKVRKAADIENPWTERASQEDDEELKQKFIKEGERQAEIALVWKDYLEKNGEEAVNRTIEERVDQRIKESKEEGYDSLVIRPVDLGAFWYGKSSDKKPFILDNPGSIFYDIESSEARDLLREQERLFLEEELLYAERKKKEKK